MKMVKNVLLIVVLVLGLGSSVQAENDFTKILPMNTTDYAYNVYDFDLDKTGKIYVLSGDEIYKLDANGKLIKKWNIDNTFHPQRLAIDKSSNFIYISDASKKIKKYDLDGNYITGWNSSTDISDIAIDNQGILYLSGGNYIKKYTSSGTLLASWGGSGSANGRFNNVSRIVVDKLNFIYALDRDNARIQKFNSSGTFIRKWNSYLYNGSLRYLDFQGVSEIAVDGHMNIYVEVYSYGIQIFDNNGNYLETMESKGSSYNNDAENFSGASSIQIDASDNIYIGGGGWLAGRIDKYNSLKEHITSFGKYGSGQGEVYGPHGIATDNNGNIYVVEDKNNRVQKFDNKGNFIKKWGGIGSSSGKFNNPTYIVINSLNEIYIVDRLNNRIQKFTASGEFILEWNARVYSSEGITIDHLDNVYLLNDYDDKIYKYNPNGVLITSWGLTDDGRSIAFNANNNHIYLGTKNDEIIKFSLNGNEVLRWSLVGPIYDTINDMTCDINGDVYVTLSQTIQKFTSSGTFKYEWTSDAYGTHQFEDLVGIASDKFGNIFITDTGGWHPDKAKVNQLNPDIDNDGVINAIDDFPFNANESLDTDNDGIGNNADTDDDNDGISDVLEIANGLDPLDASDALADDDNDGFTNTVEISVGTNVHNASSKPVWAPILMGDIITFVLVKS